MEDTHLHSEWRDESRPSLQRHEHCNCTFPLSLTRNCIENWLSKFLLPDRWPFRIILNLWFPLLRIFLFSVPNSCPSCTNYKVTSALSQYAACASKKCVTTFKTTHFCNYDNHHFLVRVPNIIMQSSAKKKYNMDNLKKKLTDFLSNIVTQMYFICKVSNVCKTNSQS